MAFARFNYLFFASFVLSAVVQYNDPDATLWIAVYLASAALCADQWRPRPLRWPAPLLCLTSTIWLISLLPAIVGKVSFADIVASISMQTQAVEEAREIGGLSIVAFWTACITGKHYREPQ
ncbi:MAG: transmembrane 220 family protein [Halioglobus sp.]